MGFFSWLFETKEQQQARTHFETPGGDYSPKPRHPHYGSDLSRDEAKVFLAMCDGCDANILKNLSFAGITDDFRKNQVLENIDKMRDYIKVCVDEAAKQRGEGVGVYAEAAANVFVWLGNYKKAVAAKEL